jgi:hypothetical protein
MQKPDSETARRFFGAWRYLGSVIEGKPRADRENPSGIIIYDPSGHMSVHIMPSREQRPAVPDHTFICYFGKWSLDETARTVTHHRENDLRADAEIDAVRQYEFVGDRLILSPVGKDQQITWERIK